jgi:hypothetical protein
MAIIRAMGGNGRGSMLTLRFGRGEPLAPDR